MYAQLTLVVQSRINNGVMAEDPAAQGAPRGTGGPRSAGGQQKRTKKKVTKKWG